jgi:hypothetical protein
MIVFYFLRFETSPTWKAKSRIYILQEQDSPVISPGVRFPFRLLLRLAGLWSCDYESSHILQPTVSRPVCLGKKAANRVESYITTDGPSASLSWNKAPILGLRPDFYCCQTVAVLLIWGAVSDERTGLSFTIAADPQQRSHSWVRFPWDSRPYLLSLIRDLPFCRLLRLAGSRWRYPIPPPHGCLEIKPCQSQSQSYVTTNGSVGQSVLE